MQIKFRESYNRRFNKWHLNRFRRNDYVSQTIIMSLAILALLLMFSLIGFVVYESVYYFQTVGFTKFFSRNWDADANQYGIGQILVSSFFVFGIALVIAIPLTILSALFIAEYLPASWKRKCTAVIQLLAGIPSVVFGLFSLSILGPLFMKLGAPSRTNLIVTCITLAFMGLPIMISLSLNAIEDVPASHRYNSLALGVSKTQTTFKIVWKTAKIRIIGAILLGVARIIGETMAVLMICGNNANNLDLNNGFLKFLYSSCATLASTIGLEVLESANRLHQSALYAIGVSLFALVTIINIMVLALHNVRARQSRSRLFNYQKLESHTADLSDVKIHNLIFSKIDARQKWHSTRDGIITALLGFATFLVIGFTLVVIGTVIFRGLFEMHFADLISTTTFNGGAGILSTFLVSVLVVVCTIVIVVPFALFGAIMLNEYMQKRGLLARSINFALNVMSSTPSIVYGLFGLILFITLLKIPLSIFAASLTLSIVVLPMLIRNMSDGIGAVPDALRHSSYSLGANKITTIRKVILPNAASSLATGIILAVARIVGETAPVYLTLGTSVKLPTSGFFSPGATMTNEILTLWRSGTSSDVFRLMYEIAFCLMFLVLLMNWLAHYVEEKLAFDRTRVTWKEKIANMQAIIKSWNMKSLAV